MFTREMLVNMRVLVQLHHMRYQFWGVSGSEGVILDTQFR
ncbi:hypothetical protein SP19_51 [Salmonella phage 19]|nr:hypothetical protein SP19_51 [Salmonella phage 19]